MSVYVSLAGKIGLRTHQELSRACAELVAERADDVHLILNSTGGGVGEGIALYNLLRAMPFRLTTYNIGRINSIGITIFLAGEMRCASATAAFMFHGVTWTVNSAPTMFSEQSLRERLESIRADQRRIAKIYEARTRLRAEDIHTLFAEERDVDATYALDVGVIHEIKELAIPPGSVMRVVGADGQE